MLNGKPRTSGRHHSIRITHTILVERTTNLFPCFAIFCHHLQHHHGNGSTVLAAAANQIDSKLEMAIIDKPTQPIRLVLIVLLSIHSSLHLVSCIVVMTAAAGELDVLSSISLVLPCLLAGYSQLISQWRQRYGDDDDQVYIFARTSAKLNEWINQFVTIIYDLSNTNVQIAFASSELEIPLK